MIEVHIGYRQTGQEVYKANNIPFESNNQFLKNRWSEQNFEVHT